MYIAALSLYKNSIYIYIYNIYYILYILYIYLYILKFREKGDLYIYNIHMNPLLFFMDPLVFHGFISMALLLNFL